MSDSVLTDGRKDEKNSSLSELARRAVMRMILDRKFRGGELIVESQLGEALGFSRTPLREALQRLEGEGLVVKESQRSYMVRHVDLAEYLQSLKMREILEQEAGVLAIGHIEPAELAAAQAEIETLRRATTYHTEAHWHSDDTVHGLYIMNCGNMVMRRVINSLRVTTRLFESERLADRLEPDSVEHLAILDAFTGGSKKAVRRTIAAHIRSLHRFALENVG